MITRLSRVAAAVALLVFTFASVASAHDATGVTASIDCAGTYTVTVGYEQFSDGHRLVTTITADGVVTVKTETPAGAGTETYTGTAKSTVEVSVTTPDDDNAPLTASAKAPTDCSVVTPPPSHHPKPTPHATPPHTAAAGTVIVPSSANPETLLLLVLGLVSIAVGLHRSSRSSHRR